MLPLQLPHLARPQQSTIVKTSTSKHCNSLRKSVSKVQEPPVNKTCKIRVGYRVRQGHSSRHRNSEYIWVLRNNRPSQHPEKGSQKLNWSLPKNSSREKLCVMVMYDYDSNAILSKPIKIGSHQPSVMVSSRSTGYWNQEEETQKFTLWKMSVLVN